MIIRSCCIIAGAAANKVECYTMVTMVTNTGGTGKFSKIKISKNNICFSLNGFILLLTLWKKSLRKKNHLEPFRFTPTKSNFRFVSVFC